MKILLIEDELSKRNKIIEFLKSMSISLEITESRSYASAIEKIRMEEYDVLLLDMSLPRYDEGNFSSDSFEAFAGLRILDEVDRLEKKCKVIVITAFDLISSGIKTRTLTELIHEMRNEYPEWFLGAIHFNSTTLEWSSKLEEFIKECKKNK